MTQSTEQQPDPRVGEIIDSRYRIVQHLATGGMASVYRAEHLNNASVVAIKILHPELASNAEVSARFRREALAARSIRHPNVVSVWDVGRLPDGCCFMVLEFIPGRDLCVALHEQRPFDQVRAVRIALQVAHALVSAHAAGVVHRDLKPDNIMLIERDGDPDFVKVVDFGIAKVKAKGAALLTVIGSVFGTPEYMAPEQARGAAVDHRTDLYTLGTVLYEMLTGATPFADKDFAQVLMGQISRQPPPLPRGIDAELAALVMTLLAKDPAHRVQTATEVRERLCAILTRLSPSHPVPAAMPAAARPVQASLPPPSLPPPVRGAIPPSARPPASNPHALGPLPPMRLPPPEVSSHRKGPEPVTAPNPAEPAGTRAAVTSSAVTSSAGRRKPVIAWLLTAAIGLALAYLIARLYV